MGYKMCPDESASACNQNLQSLIPQIIIAAIQQQKPALESMDNFGLIPNFYKLFFDFIHIVAATLDFAANLSPDIISSNFCLAVMLSFISFINFDRAALRLFRCILSDCQFRNVEEATGRNASCRGTSTPQVESMDDEIHPRSYEMTGHP
jgi:hypothetical protein